MLKMQGRPGAADSLAAIRDEPDLRLAANNYAWAAANGPHSAELLLEWGNVLHAIGEFDEAAKKFARAAEFSPADPQPWLKVAIAHLDHVNDKRNEKPELLQLLIALGASANYLGWSSKDDPSSDFIVRIKGAIGRSAAEDAGAFSKCLEVGHVQPDTSASAGTAKLKACVDQAIYLINDRNIDAVNAAASKRAAR
jgi:tetratricopeptide (TPR) repeat protein